MHTEPKQYFNYLVSFTDGAVKTGFTSRPFYRLQDYAQEARRHGKQVIAYQLTSPVADKQVAMAVETAICNQFKEFAVEGHREWFTVEDRARDDQAPSFLFFTMANSLEGEWGAHSPMLWHKLIIANPYAKMMDFAAALGSCGERIRAAEATEKARVSVLQQQSEISYRKHFGRRADMPRRVRAPKTAFQNFIHLGVDTHA